MCCVSVWLRPLVESRTLRDELLLLGKLTHMCSSVLLISCNSKCSSPQMHQVLQEAVVVLQRFIAQLSQALRTCYQSGTSTAASADVEAQWHSATALYRLIRDGLQVLPLLNVHWDCLSRPSGDHRQGCKDRRLARVCLGVVAGVVWGRRVPERQHGGAWWICTPTAVPLALCVV